MKQRYYRSLVARYFICFLGSITLCLIAFCAVYYIADPLQFFHKSWFLPANMLSANMREQVPGLINNYDFDSAIIGTSMLVNTASSEASQKLGGDFINLSVPATDFFEREPILKRVLEKKPEKIIYSLDHFYLFCSMGYKHYPSENWLPLLTRNPVRYFMHYLTRDNITHIFDPWRNLAEVELDRPNTWLSQSVFSTAFGGLKNWIANIDAPHMDEVLKKDVLEEAARHDLDEFEIKRDHDREAAMRKYIDKYLLDYARDNPSTQFYLIFPPYYRLTPALWLHFSTWQFPAYLESIRYFVEEAAKLPNVHIYGWDDHDFLDDINNYADRYHYLPRYNSMMLDDIRAGKELLPDQLDSYISRFENKAKNFDLAGFVKKANQLLAERQRALKESER